MALDQEQGRLPLTTEEITAEWLTSALSTCVPGIKVNAVEILDIRHGFTTVLRMQIDVNEEGRRAGIGPTIIVKGGFEDHSRDRARTYAMEALAYRDVWPELGLNVPKCYFADVEPERQQVMMIMEDLLARGVTFCDPFKPHDLGQATKFLSALAELHAKTWNSPDLDPGGRWESTSRFGWEGERRWVGISNNVCAMLRDYLNRFDYLTPEVWNRFLQMPRGAAMSIHLQDLDWARAALDHCADLMDVLPKCIVHGDMHLGNLYWDADGTPGFYDAPPRIEPPHGEVAYYLTCCLDPADRRQWDRALVQHYLDELRRHGVEPPGLDEMMRYFAIFLTYGLIVFLINENFFQTESFNTLHAVRHSMAMIDHDAKQVILESIKSDPYLSSSSGSTAAAAQRAGS